MKEVDRKELESLLNLSFDEIQERVNLQTPSDSSEGLGDAFNNSINKIKQKICVDWDYCKNQKKFNEMSEIDLAVKISAILIEVNPPITVALMTAYVVKYGLNKLCDCQK